MAYNPRKAAQTIAYLILKSGTQDISVLKAVKLVYLADRECIRTRGFPIQDEARFSMKHGPVNYNTFYHIKNKQTDLQPQGWSDFLCKKGKNSIQLSKNTIKEDDLDELSENEIKVLENVWENFGGMTPSQIRNWTHKPGNVSEWKDPGNSRLPISLSSIMKAVKLPNVKERVAEIDAFSRMDDTWDRLRKLANVSPSDS